MGSIGRVLNGVQVKFGENNEILLKGDTITKGYYRKAEVTALAIDSEGWFHTGDAGYMKDGELFLTERIKEVTEHVKANKHDFMAKRGLIQMVGQRKKLLKYLERTDFETYKATVAKLGLRK